METVAVVVDPLLMRLLSLRAAGHSPLFGVAGAEARARATKLRDAVLARVASWLVTVPGQSGARWAPLDFVDAFSSDELPPPGAAGTAARVLPGANTILLRGEGLPPWWTFGRYLGLRAYRNVPIAHIGAPPAERSASALGVATEGWHLDRVGGAEAVRGGQGVLVGVCDTGLDPNEPELVGRLHSFALFDEEGDQISDQAQDAAGHGTCVARLVAGSANGLAPSAGLAVAAISTRADGWATTAQMLAGLNWLTHHPFNHGDSGVDIINASFGLDMEISDITEKMLFRSELYSHVGAAWDNGIAVIAAIGNEGRRGNGYHCSPGNYDKVLGVGCTDFDGYVSDASSWGTGPDPLGPLYPLPRICAPGIDVIVPTGATVPLSGTSFAAPIVSGIAAHRVSADPALRRNPPALYASLTSTHAPYKVPARGNLGGIGEIRF
jgi:subtilisin family serine protease